MAQIFISYSHADRPFADQLFPRLRDVYNDVWFDKNLRGGQDWWEEILRRIAVCDIFIYLLSNESLGSEVCQAELRGARHLQKKILPILVRTQTRIPDDLSRIQYVDMSAGINIEGITELYAAINHHLAGSSPTSSPPLALESVSLPKMSSPTTTRSPSLEVHIEDLKGCITARNISIVLGVLLVVVVVGMALLSSPGFRALILPPAGSTAIAMGTLTLTATPIPPTATLKPPPVVMLNVNPGAQVAVGKSVAIVVRVEPYEQLNWIWSVLGTGGGQLNRTTGEQAIYTAGSKPGVDIVMAEAKTASGATLRQTVTLTVVAAPTVTPMPPTAMPSPPPTATPSASGVTLSNPQDGQTVKCQIVARGTYPLDLKEQIWPVVYIDGVYHPQDDGGKAAQEASGNWLQTVRFGNCDQLAQDRGKPFTLIIVTANDAANAAFEQYIASAKASNDWRGMPALPQGTTERARIIVTRE